MKLRLHGLGVRWIGRIGAPYHLLRLVRVVWQRGAVGVGGYSAKLTVGLRPRFYEHVREYESRALTVFGVRVHLARSFGGIYD